MADNSDNANRRPSAKKRRQHYVWRHYLEGWAKDGKLWCCHRGKVFPASPVNVANERDFYRLREMTEMDLTVVQKLLIEPLSPPLRKVVEGWIPAFHDLFRLRSRCEQEGRMNASLEAEFDTLINNTEENLHAKLETKSTPMLRALRDSDLSCLDDNRQSPDYILFLAAQYFRTPGMLTRMVSALKELQDFNVDAAFGLMRTIMATSVACGLWQRRARLCGTFLRPEGNATFTTGDQPIVNARAAGLSSDTPPTSLALYYPLLPQLAVVLDFDAEARGTDHRTLSDHEVASYNAMITEMSKGQIYGADRNAFA